MPTKRNDMDDFDVVNGTARVVAVNQTEDGRMDVLLGETCFYPRGGGQDWDTGTISSGGNTFHVQEVRSDEDGDVHHIGTMTGDIFSEGDEVVLAVDASRRELNSRIHSAGHLIDLAVDKLGLEWVPGRGAHYPDMAFVEYSGEWSADRAEELRNRIQEVVNQLITEGGENEVRYMPKEEMHTVCRIVPDYVPTDKPGRVVIYHGDFGVPCGGTHVKNLNQIGDVKITKLKKKDKAIRVSYSVRID